jgi:predicted amidohydrolase YtcJ
MAIAAIESGSEASFDLRTKSDSVSKASRVINANQNQHTATANQNVLALFNTKNKGEQASQRDCTSQGRFGNKVRSLR